MFAKTIIDSDAFLDMPMSARLLYYDLSMRADDDGFVNSPKKIMRMVGATQDDLGILAMRKFIIPFESGVVVIKHWKIHNYIRKDTYNETKYKEEKATLELDENSAYRLADSTPLQLRDESVTSPSTQVRLGKDRIGKDRLGEDILEAQPPKPTRHKYGMYENVLFTDEDYTKLVAEFPHDYTDRIERLSEYIASTGKKYKSHLATIRAWARKDTVHRPANRKGGNVFLEIAQEEGIV
jgi:hypothetical protein